MRKPKTIREQIVTARQNQGKTAADIARDISMDRSTVTRIDSGKVDPPLSTLEKYCKTLGYRIVLKKI